MTVINFPFSADDDAKTKQENLQFTFRHITTREFAFPGELAKIGTKTMRVLDGLLQLDPATRVSSTRELAEYPLFKE